MKLQSTLPKWVETNHEKSMVRELDASIHSTQMGRDLEDWWCVLDGCASIHSTQMGRDPIPSVLISGIGLLQSTLPKWVETSSRTSCTTNFALQSTLPKWVETRALLDFYVDASASIHSTQMGRDAVSSDHNVLHHASIHSTQMGRDISWNKWTRGLWLQSTLPKWVETFPGLTAKRLHLMLQSTLPKWVETATYIRLHMEKRLQSTLPKWVETSPQYSAKNCCECFNPLYPNG